LEALFPDVTCFAAPYIGAQPHGTPACIPHGFIASVISSYRTLRKGKTRLSSTVTGGLQGKSEGKGMEKFGVESSSPSTGQAKLGEESRKRGKGIDRWALQQP
jgi:hypothetical protein